MRGVKARAAKPRRREEEEESIVMGGLEGRETSGLEMGDAIVRNERMVWYEGWEGGKKAGSELVL